MNVLEAPTSLQRNPLGLNIDFMFGRGYLWAKQERLTDWITLETLRMEIPDLQFPFDARGGLSRFRNTRCLVREIEIGITEAGLQEWIARAAEKLEGFEELRVRLVEGAAHVSLRLKAFGANTYVSFRVALIPPEPPRSDEVHLSIYDYRSYGPLPYPARVLAHELLTSLLSTPAMQPPGRGDGFTVGIAGDIMSFRPIKLLLLYLFPQHGWKLPNLSGVVLDGVRMRPGMLSVRATTRDERFRAAQSQRGDLGEFKLQGTLEGQRAIAAYEAKDLFSSVDQLLFEGALERALEQLAMYRDMYGPHPELIARTFDCLLADPTSANLTEAKALCKELRREDPDDLLAMLAEPTIALLERADPEAVIARFEQLGESLRRRHELDDWVLAQLSSAQHLEEKAPMDAASRLREILKLSPRNLEALERLRALYARVGEWEGYEEVLKRLTGVYTERAALKRTYMELAHHLLDRRGMASEARLYLEKVLRLAPGDFDALHTLGEGYALSHEPLRALKAFGSAARAAEAAQRNARAAALYHRVAQLWSEELDNHSEALLAIRRALQLQQEAEQRNEGDVHPLDTLRYLETAASLSEARERWDEALRYRTELGPRIERLLEQPADTSDTDTTQSVSLSSALAGLAKLEGLEDETSPSDKLRERLLAAERALAMLYVQRDRPDAASSHWRKVLELSPADEQASSHLERYYRASGQPEQLIRFFKDLLEGAQGNRRKIELLVKLARLYDTLGMVEEASDQLREALRLEPADHQVRVALVELLQSHGRFETLERALSAVLIKVRDRDARHAILLELGRLQAGHFQQPRQAARTYFEALDLRPSDEETLEGAQTALRKIIEREGHGAPAPVGPDTASRLLERILQRRVDLLEDPLDRATLLDEIAALAQGRGATGAATEATRRAASMRDAHLVSNEARGASVDDRLDDLLGVHPDFGAIKAPSPRAPKSEDFAKPEQEFSGVDFSVEEIEKAFGTEAFDEALGRASANEANAPSPKNTIEPEDTRPKLEISDVFAESMGTPPPSRSLATQDERAEQEDREPPTGDLAGEGEGLEEESLSDERRQRLENFREKFKAIWKRPASLGSDDTNKALDKLLGDRDLEPKRSFKLPQRDPTRPSVALSPDGVTPPSEAALTARIEVLRAKDEPEALSEALRDLIALHDDDRSDVTLEQDRLARLCAEVGELLYYDLEDNDEALVMLERAHALDPNGVGASTALLNALEALYEERGDTNHRIQLLEERLSKTDSEDLATTYHLLIAQVIWDELQDRSRAEQRLERGVLDRDRHNEAAHRLLAQIAIESEDWTKGARHYEVVLSQRTGGLDEVELERDLADLYLNNLEQPDRALRHYEGVLKAAPADAHALEGLKQCHALREDWSGYLDILGREYALLLGHTTPVDLRDKEQIDVHQVAAPLRMAASQIIADAAHITQGELSELALASDLWRAAYSLWPENVEALEARIELSRELGEHAKLADDLEELADLLLDIHARFDALTESARLWYVEMGEPDRARQLYAEAIAMVEDDPSPPEGLDAARRALRALQSE